MNLPASGLPVEQFSRSPELAALSVLGAAITASAAALLATHPEIAHGATDDCSRGSPALRAEAILVVARRFELALANYFQALGREERRTRRVQARFPF